MHRLAILLTLPATVALGLVVGSCRTDGRSAAVSRVEPRPGPVTGMLAAEADTRAEAVERDPVAYLERVAAKSAALSSYTVQFTRYERRGLLNQLYGPEQMRCWYRRQPFSVRMKWENGESNYADMVYVAGQAGNKVRFVTRNWVPPLLPPPAVNRVDLLTPVTFGEAKRPLTEFGLEQLMRETLEGIRKAGDQVVVTYAGLVNLPEGGPTVHHVHLEYAPSLYKAPIQELYIDPVTDLPVGTILKLPSGAIDASYFYADLNADVELTDEHFRLGRERRTAAAADAADEPVATDAAAAARGTTAESATGAALAGDAEPGAAAADADSASD